MKLAYGGVRHKLRCICGYLLSDGITERQPQRHKQSAEHRKWRTDGSGALHRERPSKLPPPWLLSLCMATAAAEPAFTANTSCSATHGMCVLHDSTGCPLNCEVSANALAPLRYTGGTDCNSGRNTCTCNFWDDPKSTKLCFAASGDEVACNGVDVLKGATADPLRCMEACRSSAACSHAFFRPWPGECFLSEACVGRISVWVGSGPKQGGVTFVKFSSHSDGPAGSPVPLHGSDRRDGNCRQRMCRTRAMYIRLARVCPASSALLDTFVTSEEAATPSQCQRLCDGTPLCTAVTASRQPPSCALYRTCDGPTNARPTDAWPSPESPLSFRADARANSLLGAVRWDVPLLHSTFTADPSARVFNGSLYVIMSHDTDRRMQWPPRDEGQFQMASYRLMRAASPEKPIEDLGEPLTLEQVPWATSQLWAPDLIRGRDGRYHLIFPAKDRNGTFRLGAAHASRPSGPYTADPNPFLGSSSIDPSVFIDHKKGGNVYVFFGGLWGGQLERWRQAPPASGAALGPLVARLNVGMTAFEGVVAEVSIVDERGQPLKAADESRRFFEGPQVFERAGTYYLLYSTGTTHRIVYATARSVLGPFKYRGIILGPVSGWTTHASAVLWDGAWYLLHHDSTCSFGETARRCTKAARMEFVEVGGHGGDAILLIVNKTVN